MLASTSAIPHMPMPPMPTKWILVSCLRNIGASTFYQISLALLRRSRLRLGPVDHGGRRAGPGERLHASAHLGALAGIADQRGERGGELVCRELGLPEHQCRAGLGHRARVDLLV